MQLSLWSVICDYLRSSQATMVPKGSETQIVHKFEFLDLWKFKSPALGGWLISQLRLIIMQDQAP